MLCAIAKIDPVSRERLFGLQGIAEEYGIPRRVLYGHITLATYIGSEEDAFISSCSAIVSGCKAFSVVYREIRVLSATSIIAAVPDKESILSAIQSDISSCWHDSLDQWTREKVWQPHTTLVQKQEVDLEPIARAMQAQFQPFTAHVDRIEFSKVCQGGYQVLEGIDLLSEPS